MKNSNNINGRRLSASQHKTTKKRNLSGLAIMVTMALFLLLSGQLFAAIKLPALVSNHMVLQQKTKVNVWGWAAPGEKVDVTVSWSGKTYKTVASNDGKWLLKVKTPSAGGPFDISLKGENTITLSDVYIGEVWICSGQSNMHIMVGKFGDEKSWKTGVINYKEEIKNADYPRIRMFTVERKTSETLLDDVEGTWEVCSPETVPMWSGVGYFYARDLYQQLNVPIGMLNSCWGGTPCEAWTKRDVMANDSDFKELIKKHDYMVANWDSIWSAYRLKDKSWKNESANADILPPRPSVPIGLGSHKAPYGIYNAMVNPLLNYGIKGVIWYQGESNARKAWQYQRLFPAMIQSWRDEFKQGDFPFYFVQIAPHRSQNPEIRQAQLVAYRKVKNSGITIITDAGDSTNIHPRNKQVVGARLTKWALADTYGFKDVVQTGPLYKSMKVEGDKIRISFDFVGSGLVCKGDSLTHFVICGADKIFKPATAVIDGNTVVVSSKEVKNPVTVRFGWVYIPMPNLFNVEGMPASPFRTDSWDGKKYWQE